MADRQQGNILNLKADRSQYRAVSQDTPKSSYRPSPVLDTSVDWVADGLQHLQRGAKDALQEVYDTDIRLSTSYVQEEAKEVQATLKKYEDDRFLGLEDPEIRAMMNKDIQAIIDKRPRRLKKEVAELASTAYNNDINNFGIKRAAAKEAQVELNSIKNTFTKGLREDSYQGLLKSLNQVKEDNSLNYTDDLLYTQAFNTLIQSKDVSAIESAIKDPNMPERFKLRLEDYKDKASVMTAIEVEEFKLDFKNSLAEDVKKANNYGIVDNDGIKRYLLANNKLLKKHPNMATQAMAITDGLIRESKAVEGLVLNALNKPSQQSIAALEKVGNTNNPFITPIPKTFTTQLRQQYRIPPTDSVHYSSAFFNGIKDKSDTDYLTMGNKMASVIAEANYYGVNIANQSGGGQRGAFIGLMSTIYGDTLRTGNKEEVIQVSKEIQARSERFLSRENYDKETLSSKDRELIVENTDLIEDVNGWGDRADLSLGRNAGVKGEVQRFINNAVKAGYTDTEEITQYSKDMLSNLYVNYDGTLVPRAVLPFPDNKLEGNYKYYESTVDSLFEGVTEMYPELEGELELHYQGSSAWVVRKDNPMAIIYSKPTDSSLPEPLVFTVNTIRGAVMKSYEGKGQSAINLKATENTLKGGYNDARREFNKRESGRITAQ